MKYLMVPLRVHAPEAVREILCEYLGNKWPLLLYENGSLKGIESRGEGSKTEGLKTAAEGLGVSYSTLHRLTHGKLRHITWTSYHAIKKTLGNAGPSSLEVWDNLSRALTGPQTQRILSAYVRAIERGIEQQMAGSSVTWSYDFGEDLPKVEKLNSLVKQLGLPATRFELARMRIVAPMLSWPPLRKRVARRRSELLKWGIRFESELIREEARILRALLSESD